jgi:hypothetical protein
LAEFIVGSPLCKLAREHRFLRQLLWRSVSLYGLPTLPLIGIALAGAFMWTLGEYCLHRFPMRNKLAKYLKHYHLKRHYSGEGGRYGVSSPVWDWGFGTDPGRNRAHSCA